MAPQFLADIAAKGVDSSLPTSQRSDDQSAQAMPRLPQDHDMVEPIAITGFSLRFPEDATSVDSFWEMLMEGRCTATGFPEDRLSAAAIYHPDSNRRGTIPVRGGHFIRGNIAAFDAPFFSISGAEATALDPQQRGLLETTYRALENAGMPLEEISGSKTSVYTGCFTSDWRQLCFRDSEQSVDYAGLGIEASMTANRISWFFNFKGTSANVDTACSSSLVALDLACKGLINKDSDMSIVAGCNLIFSPDMMHALSNMNMLSPDNRCFSFDHRANGYARGEGFGVLVLKRLSDALQAHDVIRAVIRSTGSNQDGYTPGITQPNGDSQKTLIQETYEKAGLSMDSTRFFEAHGTGTAVGDPIEMSALGAAFRNARTLSDPLYVGAVKGNIGHLEGASGIAGVIKTIMVLEKAMIPPNVNFERINPRIDAEFLRIKFPLNPTQWPTKGLRRASVNSFGFGGTNAHAILDDAYHYLHDHGLVGHHNTVHDPQSTQWLQSATQQSSAITELDRILLDTEPRKLRPRLLVFSAKDERGLKHLLEEYLRFFNNTAKTHDLPRSYLNDLAYTLCCRRSLLPWKSFLLAESINDLRRLDTKISRTQQSIAKPNLGFVFTGQGSQWAGMGRDLLVFATFEHSLVEAEEYLTELGCQWLLREELLKQDTQSNINKPEFSQPISTAVQVALIDLLHSFGVHPTAVVGHSSGEIAAAYCLRAISSKAALKIAYYRGAFAALLGKSNQRKGSMLSVGLSEGRVQTYINQLADQFGCHGLVVACINSHKNVTISGDATQIDALTSILRKEGVFTRKLLVDVAYHSSHMEAIALDYGRSIQNLERSNASTGLITMISSVTGQKVTEKQLRSASYWVSNMVSPVRFSDAVGQLCAQSTQKIRKKLDCSHRDRLQINVLLEIGPHSTLQGPVREILSTVPGGENISYSSILRRYQSALYSALGALGELYCLGCPVDVGKVNHFDEKSHEHFQTLSDLPEYPFDHSHEYWHESRVSKRFRLDSQAKLDLLGKPVPDWNPLEAKWRNFIRVSEMSWLEDHVIHGTLIYPAAGMLVMAIEAANQMADSNQAVTGFRLKDVLFQRALTISQDSDAVETHLYLRQTRDAAETATSWSQFRLCAYERTSWHEICCGFIRVEYQTSSTEVDGGKEAVEELNQCRRICGSIAQSCTEAIDQRQLYKTLRDCGFGFGPAFQPLRNGSFSNNGEARADVELYQWPLKDHPQPHVVHPTTLDGILHLSLAALSRGGQNSVPTAVPTSIRKIWIANSGLSCSENASIRATAWSTAADNRGNEFDVLVLDASQSYVLTQVEGFRSTVVADPATTVQEQVQVLRACYHLDLRPDLDLLDRQQVSTYCGLARYQAPEPTQFYRDLTFLLFMFLSRAIEALGSAEPENLQPHLRKYISWARMQLKKYHNGDLPHSTAGWQLLSEDTQYVESLCSLIETANDQGRVFVTTGRSLLHILRGEIDPLEFLFKSNLLRDLYREINSNRTCFPELDRYLDALAHKSPDIKILEVGAGTGGTTTKILRTLSTSEYGEQCNPRYSSYCYTDVSQSFFEQARQDFQHYPRMTFKPLDIEVDPTDQGFEAESFDLIVAANVLHATKDINAALQHIRKLLRPGGKLVMYEPTQPDILRTGFVAGLMSGWWLATEDYRPWGPSLTLELWQRVLSENNFSGLDLELPDFVSTECQEGSILVTTAVLSGLERQVNGKVVIVGDSNSNMQAQAAQQLKAILRSEGPMHCEIRGFEEATSSTEEDKTVFVFLQELERSLLGNLSPDTYSKLQQLLTLSKGVLWVTAGGGACPKKPDYAIVQGLSRALRNENPEQRFTTLALDIQGSLTEQQLQSISRILKCTHLDSESGEYETEYVEIDGLLNIPRAVQASQLSQDLYIRSLPQQSNVQTIGQSPPVKLSIGSPGLLDTLHFIEDKDYMQPLRSDEVEIQVHAIGMNFQDCLIALGRVPGMAFGKECAGVVTCAGEDCEVLPGDRVVMFASETFKTFCRGNIRHVCKISEDMSFLEATAVPAQFATAWQVVHEIARIRKNETILIHAGAGGTGQAAVQISQYLGAEVFVTVSSNAKRDVLKAEYGIPEDHIFYSRDTSFAKGVKRMTEGRGVDVIINALAGESLVASWECIASYGRFIEIGKKDIMSNSSLPMFPFRKNASFTCFDGSTWLREQSIQVKKTLQVIFDLFAAKTLHVARPLHVYSISNVEEVFRLMQDGKTPGKIVLEVTPDAEVQTILDTKPSFTLDRKKTYLIAGGLGGIGRSIARWFVDRGARNLILLSRFGAQSKAALAFLKELKEHGTRVEAPPCDITDAIALRNVLERCAADMPSIKGCVQGSMVLRDALFENMSFSDWNAATACKTVGSWNLHMLLPKGLDFFIMLASASGVVGLRGQANYAAGNTYMDALARYRVAQGEKAVSLDLGAMTDDGLLAENVDLLNRVLAYGALSPISREQFLAILDYYCNPALPVLALCQSQSIIGLGSGTGPGLDGIALSRQPLFRHLRKGEEAQASAAPSDEQGLDFKKLFSESSSLVEGGAIMSQALIKKLSRTLSTMPSEVDMQQPLHTHGVDSLLAIELRSWIAKEFSADVPVFEILGGSTFSSTGLMVAARSKVQHALWTA